MTHIERLLDELVASDPTFKHLPLQLTKCLEVMVERGKRYNGSHSNVKEQNFEFGDLTAYTKLSEKTCRAKQLVATHLFDCPEEAIGDSILDAVNQGLIWMCCREDRRAERCKSD